MREKKTIIILIFILLVGIIGLTVAYFSNTTSIDNLFSTKEYGSTIEEVFVSPDNWLPSDTTEKTVTVTNSGQVDEAVRISYSEVWVAKDGTILSGLIDENGNLTDDTENSERAAIINFSNNNDWTYSNGYYYYNYRLAPNETTSSLIDSVTFNSKVKNSSNCITTENNGTKTITCNSTNSGYDGATYTLTFTIETVQYDKYMNAWNTDVAILEEQALFCDAFDVGEVVEYNNAEYYVLKDSSTSDDYVTLLKKDPLTASEVNQYSTSYVSQDGEYPYYESNTCNENNQTGCSTNYDTSSVKKIVDGWSSSFSDDLVSVDGYKSKLIDYNNMLNDLNLDYYYPGHYEYYITSYTPIWVYDNINKYWTMFSDQDNKIISISEEDINGLSRILIYNKLYIRPVINLKKYLINGACSNNEVGYQYCSLSDEVTYDNEKYYVLKDSDSNKKYVTLVKKDFLTSEDINQFSTSYVSQDGEYPFCINNSNCNSNYIVSDIKKVVDKWANNHEGINQARLLTVDEIQDYLGYYISGYGTYMTASISDETPLWVYSDNKYFWTMTSYYDHITGVYSISRHLSADDVMDKNYIRPVIDVNKSYIESGCQEKEKYEKYSIGQTINYNNEDYCVISNSGIYKDYVLLIKQKPLTYDELVIHNNGYEVGRDNEDNNVGTISYYKSNDCYYNSDYDKNTTGCSSDYDTSNIKVVIDNWSNTFNDDLKEINGYKARLITYDEIMGIGYANVMHGTQYYLEESYGTKCSGFKTWYNGGHIVPTVSRDTYVSQLSPVRPVINLKKCAITNTCE